MSPAEIISTVIVVVLAVAFVGIVIGKAVWDKSHGKTGCDGCGGNCCGCSHCKTVPPKKKSLKK